MKKLWMGIAGLTLLLGGVEPVRAGNSNRIGTAGAQELRIPVAARSVALGGAVVANATGAEALYWNPAGAATLENTEVLFTHLRYIGGMDLNYGAVMHNFGSAGNLGLSAKVLSVGDIEVTNEANPDGTGEIISPTFTTFGAHFARAMTDRVSLGASISVVDERVMREQATGLAFDFGFQYQSGWHGLKLGLVIKNLGSQMRFDGPDFDLNIVPPGADPGSNNRTTRTQSAAFDLPSSMQLGFAYDWLNGGENRVTTMAVFQSNNFSEDEYRIGGEYAYRENYFLRASFVTNAQEVRAWWGRHINKPQSESQQQEGTYLYGAAFGGGVQAKIGDVKAVFDYTFALVQNLEDNHFFTVKFLF